jgi:hypothetical protein
MSIKTVKQFSTIEMLPSLLIKYSLFCNIFARVRRFLI